MGAPRIGVALQGGGAYAAFAAGVLERLFSGERDGWPAGSLHALTGTSGGALNALLFARAVHDRVAPTSAYVSSFWRLNRMESLLRERYGALRFVPDEAIGLIVGAHRRLGALGAQPPPGSAARMREVAMDMVHDLVTSVVPELGEDPGAAVLPARPPYVTVAATEMHAGVAHLFTSDPCGERVLDTADSDRRIGVLSLRSVYASMAHPLVFEPVRIGSGVYWDGYYTRNPPLAPLLRQDCDELILVRLIQLERTELEEGEAAIRDRVEEIIQNTTVNLEIDTCFGAAARERGGPLLHEIRLLKPGNVADAAYPLTTLVEWLSGLGRVAVEGDDGFRAARARAPAGHRVVTEVNFDAGSAQSRHEPMPAGHDRGGWGRRLTGLLSRR